MSITDKLRDMYWEAFDKVAAFRAEAGPVMAEMAALRAEEQKIKEKLQPLKQKRYEIEKRHGGIDAQNAMAGLAKALGNKIGERPKAG